jgi:hypothetical protein
VAITVTLTSTQPALIGMTVLVLDNAAGEGAWAASTADLNATVTPSGTGSMVVGATAAHYPSAPPGYLTPEAGTTFDQDSQGAQREGIGWHCPAATAAGTPVTAGAGSSGLADDKAAVCAEILSAGGTITLDSSAPPPLPGPAGQNGNLGLGGSVSSRTSASFTPPPSAVLAVLATNSYGTGSIFLASESSGLYTWTRDAIAVGGSVVAAVLIGVPPAPPPSGPGSASVALSAAGSGARHAAGSGTAHAALAAAAVPAYPGSPAIVSGTQVLMIALTELEQSSLSGRLPNVPPGSACWVRSVDAPGLQAGGLAAYAPAGTAQPPAEPPWTAGKIPGFGRGTSNSSPGAG